VRQHLFTVLLCLLTIAACGGGSGATTASTASSGSSSSGSNKGGTTTGTNVQPVTVDIGPSTLVNRFDVNTLFTSVTICVPGTSTCQTIDHIQVDTGSSGLRILSSVLTLTLPQRTTATNGALVECTQFVDGYSWGPLQEADIKISGESAKGQAVQIIGDTTYPVPSGCSSNGTAENTVETFGANGILGVGPFVSDCGPGCAQIAANGIYYVCPTSSTCAQTVLATDEQVLNPVAAFTTDNNGVIITLPAVDAAGADTVTGSLIFGIGTQSNNTLGSATIYTVDDGAGSLTSTYKGATLSDSFIDSGSNALYFPDSTIATCADNTTAPGFYCPTSTLNLSGTITGLNNKTATISFSVANADSIFTMGTTIAAAPNLAAPSTTASAGSDQFDGSSSFDWGLPFYFGRDVYTALEAHTADGTAGPYFAF
jgi:Protein of unknown function (DUF3443)